MDRDTLASFLKENYSKTGNLYLLTLIERDELNIHDVLFLCNHDDPKIVFRTSWLLEHIEDSYPERFKHVLEDFIFQYPNQNNESAIRCFTKILMNITSLKGKKFYNLNFNDLEDCLSATFDWLINEKIPVAIKCNCIDIIYHLRGVDDWIELELLKVLEDNLTSSSPALLSRTKKILRLLKYTKSQQ